MAREAVAASLGLERQAGAVPNPWFSYGREQAARGGQVTSQDVAQLEQVVEVAGQRALRRDAARLRRESAEARLDFAAAQLDFDVTAAFYSVRAADRRARLAEELAASFAEAQRVSEQRLTAGDVSGYTARRMRLETARLASERVAASLERRSARVALATLLGLRASAADSLVLADVPNAERAVPSLDSVLLAAERHRLDLRAAALGAAAAAADARLASKERVPSPSVVAGYKGERGASAGAGPGGDFHGFVAGVSLPLPLFDRRQGAVAAADANARRAEADRAVLRRQVRLEVVDALDRFSAATAQLGSLRPLVASDARTAARAVNALFAEGEISLLEWLDGLRAFQQAESTLATLEAEIEISWAELERVVGAPLAPVNPRDR